jgi:hypothetical protein
MAARPEISGKALLVTPDEIDCPAGPPDGPRLEARAHDVAGTGISSVHPPIRGPPVAYTIESFCAAHHISKAFFHKLRSQGLGPRLTRIGSRVLITAEAAAAWRAAREAETIQESA